MGYIASHSPQAARRVREGILEAVRNLVSFPHQGQRRMDLTSRPLRFIRVRDYLIAYAPDEKPLWVSGHTLQSTSSIEAELREQRRDIREEFLLSSSTGRLHDGVALDRMLAGVAAVARK